MENARLYSLPDAPPPVYVSGFGPKAVSLAARVADGYCGTSPDAELVEQYRSEGGSGPAQAGVKVCWGIKCRSPRRALRRQFICFIVRGIDKA